jgi:glutamine cyclotransferase
LILLLGGCGLLMPAVSPAQEAIPRFGFRVVEVFPHDIDAFTQGLVYRGGYLYEGTGKNGQSRLSKIDLDSGETLQSEQLSDRYFGEGIEIVGDSIFQLTWRSNMVFQYERDSFAAEATHYNPTEGWGLAYDGEHLILSDGTASLQFIDPEGFRPVRQLTVTVNGEPVNYLNELEYIDGEVWANVWQTDFIVRVDPDSGAVNSIVDLSGLSAQTRLGSREAVLNGIAWDAENQRLLVTGKHWANLFHIELVPQ